jgi:tetratricopeptide (TPR) repeat protein
MFYIFPFVLIVCSLAVILVIVIKKFPQLSLLDVESLPEVKEEKKKNQVLQKRVNTKTTETKEKQSAKLTLFLSNLKKVQSKFRGYVGDVEKRVMEKDIVKIKKIEKKLEPKPKKEVPITETKKDKVKNLIKQAKIAFEAMQLDVAESSYISVIRLDNKNTDAYRGLIDVYFKRGQYDEAGETCEFLLQLNPKDDWGHVRMAEISEEQGDIPRSIQHYQEAVLINDSISTRFAKLAQLLQQVEQYETAIEAIEQALDIEPDNPKYLDNFVELAIIVIDKTRAKDGYERLRLANPGNKKLDTFKQRIAKM